MGKCLMIWRASESTGSLCGIDSRISVSIFKYLDSQMKSNATIRVTIRTIGHLILYLLSDIQTNKLIELSVIWKRFHKPYFAGSGKIKTYNLDTVIQYRLPYL